MYVCVNKFVAQWWVYGVVVVAETTKAFKQLLDGQTVTQGIEEYGSCADRGD